MNDNTDFQTPPWVCEKMIELLPQNITTVLEPTPGTGNLVKSLNGYTVTAPENFWNTIGTFDAIVMNPPFSPMTTGYNILYRCMTMTNIIITVMPWLTLINSKNRTRIITA